MADGGLTTAALIVSAVSTVASTGIAMYSSSQAAQSQAAIADYNRQINQQNAQWQQMAAQRAADTAAFNSQLQMFNAQSQQMQAQFTQQAATFQNEQMRMQSQFTDMQAELQKNTAALLRQQATGEEEQAQAQADRIRKEKARILGLQKSQYAKGNVLSSAGSSLWVLSETAELFERQAVDTRLLANLNASKSRYEAGVTDFNAGITSLEASAMRDQANINEQAIDFNLNQDMFQANLNLNAARMAFDDAQFEKSAAGAGYRIAQRQAQLQYMSGMAESRATAMGTWGSLASGAGQLGSIGMTYYGSRPSNNSMQPLVRKATPVRR
jgi:DNA repair exonuclease SbcCD ATPase subunit